MLTEVDTSEGRTTTAFGPDSFWQAPLLARTAFGPDSFWPAPGLTAFGPDLHPRESFCRLFCLFSFSCVFQSLFFPSSFCFFPQLFDGCDISGEKIIFLSRLAEEARKRPHRPTKENHKPGNDVEIEDKASEHVINDLWFEARINNPRTRLPERCKW